MIIELISCAAKPSFPIIILLGFYSDFKEGLGFYTLISEKYGFNFRNEGK